MAAGATVGVHVIGAGLSGLSAAMELAGRGFRVRLHEASPHAGGRCRSYFDATLGAEIDNGNHLVLSGNRAVSRYLGVTGSADKLSGPASAEFPFLDRATGARWRLRPNDGPLPWWFLLGSRRAPGTRAIDYLGAGRLLMATGHATIADAMATRGAVWDKVWRPILLSALNTEPELASARLAGAIVRETLAAGGAACRPLIAHDGLAAAFVTPAVHHLTARGHEVAHRRRLDAIEIEGSRVTALRFDSARLAVAPGDRVVLAVPPTVAKALLPGLAVPDAFRAIANAHYRFDAPAGAPAMLGLVNGLAEWIFTFPGRVSVTVSGADRLIGVPREQLAADIWRDVVAALGLTAPLPAWQIIIEKRATFAALPEQDAKRPGARVAGLDNLALAGDWTATGLPATIEGAIRSGVTAASVIGRL